MTPDLLDRIDRVHDEAPDGREERGWCPECRVRWPCDVAVLADGYRVLLAHVDAASDAGIVTMSTDAYTALGEQRRRDRREIAHLRAMLDQVTDLAALLASLLGGRDLVETALADRSLGARRLGRMLGRLPAGEAPTPMEATVRDAVAAGQAARRQTLEAGGDDVLATCRSISEGRAVLLRARRFEVDALRAEIAACPAEHPSRS